MQKIDIRKFSDSYAVRRLDAADVDMILSFCRENTQYYEYCGRETDAEQIKNDMCIAPPGIPAEQKYYIGFFDGSMLAAVMDIIDGYPDPETAFIGFFMMKKGLQGRGIGSGIVSGVFAYLKTFGFERCRLGIDQDNPQSNRFWRKNGFCVLREIETENGIILLAEKRL
ncbi:MAG: GNAT family N-acetyltransferase [Clostridia bacterium]|nr:GNAT family N-acetyltransferase [Clostridia bacterium]